MKVIYNWEAYMSYRGGVARLFYELAKYGFEREGVDFHLGAGLYRNLYLHNDINTRRKSLGLYVYKPFDKYKILTPLNKAFFPLYSLYHSADICHYTYLNTPFVPRKTKTIVTIHDLIHELFLPDGMNVPAAVERRKALDKVNGIICVSENTKHDLMNLYPKVNPDVIKVIYNGNDIHKLNTNPYIHDRPYLLYVGDRHREYKNYNVILKALSENGELNSFDLICFGGGELTQEEISNISSLGLSGRVLQTAGSDLKLAQYYAGAFAFIYPSKYEGFGMTTVEAMSIGCPVVCSNAPPMPEVNGEGALYFSPESSKELIDCILRLKDNSYRSSCIENGRKSASKYSWERCCKETYDFYEEILA